MTTAAQTSYTDLGVTGDPLPYTVKNDTLMSIVLLGCLLLFFMAVSRSMPFFVKQARNFFRSTVADDDMNETSTEVRLQICLVLLDCLLLALAAYQYCVDGLHTAFGTGSHAPIIALYTAIVAAYFLLKALVYTAVNLTLFNGKRNVLLLKSLLFINAIQAMLLLPLVLLQIYLGFGQQTVTYFCIFIVIITKLLTFYKSWSIFFKKNGAFLQTFLYFCTLEIAPLLAMGGILVLLTDALKVNY